MIGNQIYTVTQVIQDFDPVYNKKTIINTIFTFVITITFSFSGKIRRGSSAHFPSRYMEPAAWLQRRLSASSTEANFLYMPRRLSYSSRDSSDSSLFLPRRMSACSIGSDSFYSRRMSAASQSSDSSTNRSRSNSSAFQNGENVVRMPKGPDGSRGFCRQRPSLPTVVQ